MVAVDERESFTFAVTAALQPVLEGSDLLLSKTRKVFILLALLPQEDGTFMCVYGVTGEAFDFFEVEEELLLHDLVLK